MKVHVYPADVHGCGHYRMIWPALRLKELGYDVTLHMPHQREDIRAVVKNDVVTDVGCPEDADVLVFQRVTHKYLSQAIPVIRKKGIAVVIDMDDNLSRLDPTNPAFKAMHPDGVKYGISEHSWHFAEQACKNATVTTVSTDALIKQYGTRGQGIVIRNAVHDSIFNVISSNSETFGYPGAIATHYTDVAELGSSVARLVDDGFRFATIGDVNGIKKLLRLSRDIDEQHGPVSLKNWPATLATLGVGLVPLVDTEFNRAKSWLKPLELAAVGVPCVMSPSAEYRRIHKLGIGVLARRPSEFYSKTKQLLSDEIYRYDMGVASREIAMNYKISNCAIQWWNAWTHAYDLQQTE